MGLHLLPGVLVAASLVSSASAQSRATPSNTPSRSTDARSEVYRVFVGQDARRLALLAPFDVLGACCGAHAHAVAHDGSVRVVVFGKEREALLARFPKAKLVDRGRPFREIVAQRRALSPQSPPDSNYYTVAEVERELLTLERSYPKIAKRIDLNAYTKTAKTHEGRTIYALKISDNVAKAEDEPQSMIVSQHHARELNTPHITLSAAKRILASYASDSRIKRAVDGGEIWIVPTVNPDGVNAVWNVDRWWRKNRRKISGVIRGVDLNRNYPFRWGACGASSNPGSQIYKGPSPASEPETQTMMAFARMQRFEKYLDFHSYGREILDTYSPCTSNSYVGNKMLPLIQHYRNRLARAASYRVRPPTASGEAPEWHWAENGTMSFLTEIGRSFQPPFSETVTEERRVWPLVLDFLAWTPAFRGHVHSLRAKAPLGATLDPRLFAFKFGETVRSSSATGRLHLWLPSGKSRVDVAAAGHVTHNVNVDAPALGQSKTLDVTLIPKLPAITVSAPSTLKLGNSTAIGLSTNDPGKAYWIAMSLGNTPGLPIGPRVLPLRPDPILWLSMTPIPGFFDGQLGKTDAQGKAAARFAFPRVAAFAGFRFWFAAVTIEGGGLWPFDVKAISAATSLRLVL